MIVNLLGQGSLFDIDNKQEALNNNYVFFPTEMFITRFPT